MFLLILFLDEILGLKLALVHFYLHFPPFFVILFILK